MKQMTDLTPSTAWRCNWRRRRSRVALLGTHGLKVEIYSSTAVWRDVAARDIGPAGLCIRLASADPEMHVGQPVRIALTVGQLTTTVAAIVRRKDGHVYGLEFPAADTNRTLWKIVNHLQLCCLGGGTV